MSSTTVACGGTSTSTEQYRCAPFVTSMSTFPELLSVIRRSGAICPPRCRHRCIAISVVPANADALVNDRIRLVSREPDLAEFLAACASGQELRERGSGRTWSWPLNSMSAGPSRASTARRSSPGHPERLGAFFNTLGYCVKVVNYRGRRGDAVSAVPRVQRGI